MGSTPGSCRVTFLRDGRSLGTVTVAEDQDILEAADLPDLGMAYGCRDGSCVRCIGRLAAGRVRYSHPPTALSEAQREEGFVLLCVAQPETDCRVEVGRSVLEEAFPQLWRPEGGFR